MLAADLFALSKQKKEPSTASSFQQKCFLIKVVHIVVRVKTQLSVFNAREKKVFDAEKFSCQTLSE
jgi:hypothetical protein